MIKKRPSKALANPYRTSVPPEDLGAANRIAYDIVAERRDLLPSVERIMNAGLAEDATVRAMTLFQNSLVTAGDPHRDPAVAIINADPGAVLPTQTPNL